MSDEETLLAAVRDHPAEDTPRLVYADWLDENATNDVQRARAEFIRLQHELDNLYGARGAHPDRYRQLEQRADELERQFRKAWLAEFPGAAGKEYSFSGGFLSLIELNARTCATAPRPAWDREPLLGVHLTGTASAVRRLLARGWLDGVSDLTLRPGRHDEALPIAEALAGSSCAPGLRRLSIWDEGFSDAGLRVLAAGNLTGLRELSCRGHFTAARWGEYLHSPAAECLEDLTILQCPAWPSGDQTPPGPALATVLVGAPAHSRLKALWLSHCGLGNAGLSRLASRGRFDRLEQLHIDDDRFGVPGLRELGRGAFPALKELRLHYDELRDAAVRQLVGSPLMARLEQLDLSSNRLTSAGLRAVATCGKTRRLRYLDMGFNGLGDAGVVALARSRKFTSLEELHLSSAELTDTAATAIAKAVWVKQLTTLFLSYNDISQKKCAELDKQLGGILWMGTRDRSPLAFAFQGSRGALECFHVRESADSQRNISWPKPFARRTGRPRRARGGAARVAGRARAAAHARRPNPQASPREPGRYV